MPVLHPFLSLAAFVALCAPALSQAQPVELGGDTYVSGPSVSQPLTAGRDLTARGARV